MTDTDLLELTLLLFNAEEEVRASAVSGMVDALRHSTGAAAVAILEFDEGAAANVSITTSVEATTPISESDISALAQDLLSTDEDEIREFDVERLASNSAAYEILFGRRCSRL